MAPRGNFGGRGGRGGFGNRSFPFRQEGPPAEVIGTARLRFHRFLTRF